MGVVVVCVVCVVGWCVFVDLLLLVVYVFVC